MKQHLFYAFLFLFIITAIVTLLGITEVIKIRDQYLTPLFGSLLIELVGAVIALYRGAKFFDEPLHTEQPLASTKLPAARVAGGPAAPELTTSKRQPLTPSVVLRSPTVDGPELDLAEFFVKYDQLERDGRFLERDKFKTEIKGKKVVFRGAVYDVTDISEKLNVFVRDGSPKFHNVIFPIGASQRAEAHSLRKGDMLEVRGIGNAGGVTYIGIENGSFTRMDAKQA